MATSRAPKHCTAGAPHNHNTAPSTDKAENCGESLEKSGEKPTTTQACKYSTVKAENCRESLKKTEKKKTTEATAVVKHSRRNTEDVESRTLYGPCAASTDRTVSYSQ